MTNQSTDNPLGVLEGKRVLVTGGCGFIGSWIATELAELGAEVTVFDCHIKPIHPKVKIIQGDVRKFEEVNRAVREQEYVFHLAAILGVEKIQNIPLQVLDNNLGGTINVLKAAHENSVKRFIYTSSSEVYGNPKKVPISEEAPTSPISIYGIGKLAGEAYCTAYYREYGLEYTILRYFNVYGPGQTDKFVMPIFLSRVLRGLSPIVYGNGSQSRAYTYITDAVNGTLLAAASEKSVCEIFNIGNSEAITLTELAQYIIDISGNHLKPIFKNFGEGIRMEKREVIRREPDISKAQQILGFELDVSWQKGVKQFSAWYKSRLMKGERDIGNLD